MLTITGEVRKVLDDEYKDGKGNTVKQAIIVIEPDNGRQNYEVFLTRAQVNSGMRERWDSLKGKRAAVSVALFVNWDYKFYKFNAIGAGEPLSPKGAA